MKDQIAIMIGIALGAICLIAIANAYGSGLDVQTTISLGGDATWWELVEHYWWHGLAILASPVVGFSAGQFYKLYESEKTGAKPGAISTAAVNGVVTALFALMMWPGTWDEKAKIAVMMGFIWPFIVLAWFVVAERFAPKHAANLKGSNGELTVLPWVKVRKHKPAPEPDATPKDYADDDDPTVPQ